MMRILRTLLGTAMAAAFFAAALLSATELVAYGIPDHLPNEFSKYDVYSDLPMSREDADRVMEETMDYLRGDRESLEDVTARIAGVDDVPFYNEEEISHMADVRMLFVGGLKLRNALAVFLAVCVCICIYVCVRPGGMSRESGRPGHRGGSGREHDAEAGKQEDPTAGCQIGRRWCAGVLKTFAMAQLAMIAVCIATAVYASTDFTGFFTKFHEIFFPQGNWEFDPAKSLMINMLPEGLFADTAAMVVAVHAVIEIAAIVGAWYMARRLEARSASRR